MNIAPARGYVIRSHTAAFPVCAEKIFLKTIIGETDELQMHMFAASRVSRWPLKENRITRYLWKKDFDSEEEYEKTKEYYQSIGYRIVTLAYNPDCGDMSVFFRQLVKNHVNNQT